MPELGGRTADPRLLDGDLSELPASIGRPESAVPSRLRGRLVAAGATLTGASLLAGIALIALGVVDAAAGGVGLRDVGAFVLGLALVGTHWGWVHVAEATADAVEGRRARELHARRRRWLAAIEPYTRHEVTTSVDADGAIRVLHIRHRPVASGADAFVFVREIVDEEVHDGDEPAAVVAERAEVLRREAALATARERARFEAAETTRRAATLHADDEARRARERHTTSRAVSDQINAGLRDPPLDE